MSTVCRAAISSSTGFDNFAIITETIETKVARITQNKEPITDSAPIIFTEKKDGVLPAYNIRTDRFDIALEAMDKIGRSKAKRENAPKPEDFGNVPNKTEGGTPSEN